MLGELRGHLQVFERRYGSYSGLLEVLPASCTDSEFGGPNASSGLWQNAQDMLPEAESEGSRNILRPSAVSASTRP